VHGHKDVRKAVEEGAGGVKQQGRSGESLGRHPEEDEEAGWKLRVKSWHLGCVKPPTCSSNNEDRTNNN
jgi:hypothetical protein